jgi:hypothetical protein
VLVGSTNDPLMTPASVDQSDAVGGPSMVVVVVDDVEVEGAAL